METVHARFKGERGSFAQFGDSITVSDQFWSWMRDRPAKMDAETALAYSLVNNYQNPVCWDKWKGPDFGNESATTLDWALQNIDGWLQRLNPETIVIMFGTNDLGRSSAADYEQKYRQVIQRCLDNGSVVIVTTIPPKSGAETAAAEFAEVVRRLANEFQLPLIDYHAEILSRRPRDWNGSAPEFSQTPGDDYQVPTLISRDGVHPSAPENTRDFSPGSLSTNGYALRSYLTLQAYANVIRAVYRPVPFWVSLLPYLFIGVLLIVAIIAMRSSTQKNAGRTPDGPPAATTAPMVAAESTAPTAVQTAARSEATSATETITPTEAPPATTNRAAVQVLLLPQSSAAARSVSRYGLMIRSFPFRIGRYSERAAEEHLERPELVLEDRQPYVLSRKHLIIELTEAGEVCLRDQGSRLGFVVDGHQLGTNSEHQQVVLKPGGYTLVLGSERFQFDLIIESRENEPSPAAATT